LPLKTLLLDIRATFTSYPSFETTLNFRTHGFLVQNSQLSQSPIYVVELETQWQQEFWLNEMMMTNICLLTMTYTTTTSTIAVIERKLAFLFFRLFTQEVNLRWVQTYCKQTPLDLTREENILTLRLRILRAGGVNGGFQSNTRFKSFFKIINQSYFFIFL
jgi:hypothetical protein